MGVQIFHAEEQFLQRPTGKAGRAQSANDDVLLVVLAVVESRCERLVVVVGADHGLEIVDQRLATGRIDAVEVLLPPEYGRQGFNARNVEE